MTKLYIDLHFKEFYDLVNQYIKENKKSPISLGDGEIILTEDFQKIAQKETTNLNMSKRVIYLKLLESIKRNYPKPYQPTEP